MSDTLLAVRNLSVTYRSDDGDVRAVRNVSFTLGRERLGIVGESGSGKSTTGRAIMGLVGLLLFYATLGWVGGPGRLDVAFDDIVTPVTGVITIDSLLAGEYEVFWNALSHLVLPASILGYLSLAYIARMTRSFMLGQLRQEYVLATLAKGLSPWRVVWVHALGNVWVQLVTIIALTFGSLLEGAVLTETVFAWPGLGLYIKNSLFNADLNAVLGGTVLVGVVYIGLNMLSDLIYPLVDPRARDRQ